MLSILNKIPAILWDGQKQINGEIQIFEDHLQFKLIDFEETTLNFKLEYKDIAQLKYHSIFDIEDQGIEIISTKNLKNVFIVESPIELYSFLNSNKGMDKV